MAFSPCPGYDVEATESWLESMAEQGYVLSEDGFFLGFACFHPSEPQKIRYRLDVPIRKSGLFAETPDGPTQEEEALSRESGWRYITKRGDFHIFACDDPKAPEFHTDPQVQALSLRKIRSRARNNLISTVIWLGIYLLFSGIWVPLSTWIAMGTPLALAWNLLLIWSILDSLFSTLYLRGLWKKLKDGAPPDHKKEWKSRARGTGSPLWDICA